MKDIAWTQYMKWLVMTARYQKLCRKPNVEKSVK